MAFRGKEESMYIWYLRIIAHSGRGNMNDSVVRRSSNGAAGELPTSYKSANDTMSSVCVFIRTFFPQS
jgi:hypothetical protein